MCINCCMSESCSLTNPSLTRSALPSDSQFSPSVRRGAFDLLQHLSLSHLGAQSSQKTDSLESYSIPSCKAGCRHNICSMLLLLELEIVCSPSPGWGPAGLGGPPHWSVSGHVQTMGTWVAEEDWEGARLSGVLSLTAHTSQGPWWSNEFKCLQK